MNRRDSYMALFAGIVVCIVGLMGCVEKPPNWYYYWEKDDVITGLDADGDPASRWSSDSTDRGGASRTYDAYALSDLCITKSLQFPVPVTHKLTHEHDSIGCLTIFGIQSAAVTMAHEKQHISNRHFVEAGNPDTDGDRLADSEEGPAHYNLVVGLKDTYDLMVAFLFLDYGEYGDNEFICRKNADDGAANEDQDWTREGAQWGH